MVSGLVVKARTTFSEPSSLKNISTPSLFPIQFLCMVLTRSGQFSRAPRLLSSSSAYLVMLKNHCSRSFCVTSFSQRQHFPSWTCSLARTVLQLGHQLTFAFFL